MDQPDDRTDLERQRPLGLTLPRSVTVVGCGGVGSWVAMFLALAGVPVLYLWDNDEVSETNLNRLPLGPSYIGSNKALAMRHMIGQLKPSCMVLPFADRWSPETQAKLTDNPEWIVACTDTWASRKMIYGWASTCPLPADHSHSDLCEPRAKYIEASADGEYGGCTGEPAMFASRLETDAGYASVPVWVGPCVSSAYMVCSMILHNAQIGPSNYRIGFRYAGSDRTGPIPMIEFQHS